MQDPALDRLWRELPSPLPLMKLLGPLVEDDDGRLVRLSLYP